MSTASAARIGRWLIATAPPGWYFVPDFGLRHGVNSPSSNMYLNQDELLAGDKLEPYIQAQKSMLARKYDSPDFAGPKPTPLLADQVDESMLLLIRHQPTRGQSVMQVQVYVRIEKWIGVVTLTTSQVELPRLRPDYEHFVSSLRIVADGRAD